MKYVPLRAMQWSVEDAMVGSGNRTVAWAKTPRANDGRKGT